MEFSLSLKVFKVSISSQANASIDYILFPPKDKISRLLNLTGWISWMMYFDPDLNRANIYTLD